MLTEVIWKNTETKKLVKGAHRASKPSQFSKFYRRLTIKALKTRCVEVNQF